MAVEVSDLLMVHASLLWLGPSAVLSGSWAAWWHDLRFEPAGPVTITMPLKAPSRSQQHVKVRRRNIAPADTTLIRGVPVIGRALAALENAQLHDGQDIVDRALQRYVSVPELADAMSRFANASGAAAAWVSLGLAGDGTVSPPERKLAAALRRAGLSEIKAGVHVRIDGRRYWLDLGVERLKLAIEVDGVSAHSDPKVFHSDRKRQNALVKDRWTILRYTPWQLRVELPAAVAEIHEVYTSLEG